MAGKVEESQDYTRPTMIYKCQVANYLKSEIEVVNNLTHFPTTAAIFFPSHDKNVSSGGILSARRCLRTRIFFYMALEQK